MKKVTLLLIVVLSAFIININPVEAAEVKGTDAAGTSDTVSSGERCPVFGDPNNPEHFAYYLQAIFNFIKFLGPVLVLVMTIIDLVKVTAEQKQDGELQKLGVKTLKRFIYAILIFIIPTLITFFFNLIGLYGTCGIS